MATFNHRRFANPDALKAIHPQHLLEMLQPHALYLAGRRFVVPGAPITIVVLLEPRGPSLRRLT